MYFIGFLLAFKTDIYKNSNIPVFSNEIICLTDDGWLTTGVSLKKTTFFRKISRKRNKENQYEKTWCKEEKFTKIVQEKALR